MPSRSSIQLVSSTAVLLFFLACGGDDEQPSEAADSDASAVEPLTLVDSTIAPAVAGRDGWNYHLTTSVDMNGDGEPEEAVITARVEMYQGRPAWDDGQPWQVYVEAADGSRTYVYAQRLQLGTLTMRVTRAEDERPTIVLIEHLPDRIRIVEVSYAGPSDVSVSVPFERMLDPRGDTASPEYP